MAEVLIKAGPDNVNADPILNTKAMWKRGMPVSVMPDGHVWGSGEQPPRFIVLKIPQIGVARVQKYIAEYLVGGEPVMRRLWQVRLGALPPAAIDKLRDNGFLIIKATAEYTGAFDYTWTQVKTFFRNLQTGLDEIEDLELVI